MGVGNQHFCLISNLFQKFILTRLKTTTLIILNVNIGITNCYLLSDQEPVSKWCNVDGHNLLDLLYKNPQKWSFAFQSMVQLARLNIVTESSNSRVKMIERSLQNNR